MALWGELKGPRVSESTRDGGGDGGGGDGGERARDGFANQGGGESSVWQSVARYLSPRRYPFFPHLYRKNWPDQLSMHFLRYASAEYTPLKGTMWFNCSLPFHFRHNSAGYFYQVRANPLCLSLSFSLISLLACMDIKIFNKSMVVCTRRNGREDTFHVENDESRALKKKIG